MAVARMRCTAISLVVASGCGSTSPAPVGDAGPPASGSYDDVVLADGPVAYWAMDQRSGTEPDRTGHGHSGTYPKGTSAQAALPNGDVAADFNGADQYLTVPSSAAFSIPTTGNLTWEAWIRPDVLQFPHDDGIDRFVDWMGKCQDYAPTCEWDARMYSTVTTEGRPNRLSAYVFNPDAGLGSSADWQPEAGQIVAGAWHHVVAEYTTLTTPSNCTDPATYPGSIDIWLDGVRWDRAAHGDSGCMSQYQIVPQAGGSSLNIGTMAADSWFAGAVGKVAIYDRLLGDAQIAAHVDAMTGHRQR
jgi:Concanavalin A-like lectin/glucanases superfamily